MDNDLPCEPDDGRTQRQRRRLYLLAAALIVLLAAVLLTLYALEPAAAGEPLRVGLARNPLAYGACTLFQDRNGLFSISLADSSEAVLADYQSDRIDAAILPADAITGLDPAANTIAALTSSLNLVVVEKGGAIDDVAGLAQQTVTVAESLRDTVGLAMFRSLIQQAGVSVSLSFAGDADIERQAGEGQARLLLLAPEQAAGILLDDRYRSCFNTAVQWQSVLGAEPPAGGCLVVRSEAAARLPKSLKALLSDLEASTAFTDSHRAKSAAMIVSNGLGKPLDKVHKTISHCQLCFHKGRQLTEALAQLASLTGSAGPQPAAGSAQAAG